MSIKGTIELLKEAIPAVGGTAATGITGMAFAAPGWLIAIGQAAIVVIFTVKAIDKRLERYDGKVSRLAGRVEALHGRVDELDCMACERREA